MYFKNPDSFHLQDYKEKAGHDLPVDVKESRFDLLDHTMKSNDVKGDRQDVLAFIWKFMINFLE